MVERVRDGMGLRAVAREFRVSLSVVQRWIARAGSQRLDRVDWIDKSPSHSRRANRTSVEIESEILSIRTFLAKQSDLGQWGAEAIQRELLERNIEHVPSVRTIGRVLERNGALDAYRRVRTLAPPPGWYLPEVAARRAELDSFDTVSGLLIAGGPEVVVLNGISLHGGLVTSWPRPAVSSVLTASLLGEHWREFGAPAYAQFDNDTIFQGPHQHPDTVGRVSRTCLQLGVIPVFVPPREPGFQASIESYNGRWQSKVWQRFRHRNLTDLTQHSDRYVNAARTQAAQRIERAPSRTPLPSDPRIDLQESPRGLMIYIRRADDSGHVALLGRQFFVDPHRPHRLVRAEVHFDEKVILFFALRRREPALQPLLATHPYAIPQRRFRLDG